jgi:RNA polymerase sigma factor (sigma-70 family)
MSRSVSRSSGKQPDTESEEAQLAEHSGLVNLIVSKFIALGERFGLEKCDLQSAGNLGLLLAIRRYKPRGGTFATYAFTYVRGHVMTEINRARWGRSDDWVTDAPTLVPINGAASAKSDDRLSPLDALIRQETVETVQSACLQAGHDGQLVKWRILDGVSSQELRDQYDCRNYAITRQLHRGFRKIRKLLDPMADDLCVDLRSLTRSLR